MPRRQPVTALRGNAGRRPIQEARFVRKATPTRFAAPVGGWNARDSLSMMRSTDAVKLENWFPRQSDVITRPGYSEHCNTGETGNVLQLMTYEFGTSNKLLAAVSGKILDVTTSTASSLATGLASNNWVHFMFSGLLFMVNGADVVKSYNGSTISNPSFTGVTLSDLVYGTSYKSRIYFAEKNSQSMWYGSTGAVSGALTKFDFSGVTTISGNLMIITHLKGDGGDGGNDDVFVAIFESGDVLAYVGSNPSDAANWTLVGKYKIGRPLSRLGVLEIEDDVYIVTSRGYEAIGRMLRYGQGASQSKLVSEKIQGAVSAEIESIGASSDWRVFLHPRGQMMIVTVPSAGASRNYHVQNINTKSWCRFTGFSAYSWALLTNQPYFGGAGGRIYKFDDGSFSDNGTQIVADAQPAWTDLRRPGFIKQTAFVSIDFQADATPLYAVSVGADYEKIPIGEFIGGGAVSGATWDSAVWDVDEWAQTDLSFRTIVPLNADGDVIGVRIVVYARDYDVKWHGTTIIHTTGGLL